MHLFLVRHAHALDGKDDEIRPLSRKGRRQVQDVGRLLRGARAARPELVWHSRLLRAEQTARLLHARLKLHAPLTEVAGLEPGADPEATLRAIRRESRNLMVVGHDPHLSGLATLMLTGRIEPPCLNLKKGAVLRLDRSGTGWTVRWLVTPELA